MKADQSTKFKKRLEKLKTEILSLIQKVEEPVKSGEALDEIDQATDSVEQEMGSLMSSNFYVNLDKVNEALTRLDKGSYGNCLRCTNEISVKRLEVLPFARLCISCQKEMENDEQPDS